MAERALGGDTPAASIAGLQRTLARGSQQAHVYQIRLNKFRRLIPSPLAIFSMLTSDRFRTPRSTPL